MLLEQNLLDRSSLLIQNQRVQIYQATETSVLVQNTTQNSTGIFMVLVLSCNYQLKTRSTVQSSPVRPSW